MLAIALTALILTVAGTEETLAQDVDGTPAAVGAREDDAPERADEDTDTELDRDAAIADASESVDQATNTVRGLVRGFFRFAPKLLVALLVMLLAWVLATLAQAVIRRVLGGWERREAIGALTRIVLLALALAAALAVLAGDARALVGSVGLIGLALSWALQTPIESFSGWLINSFRGYYRVGDRIEVGEVFGDVYEIDVLTTTVWEAGGPGKAVAGAQPTGAMITFPNWEVLRSNVINYTRDFPYVWDEIAINVANESDLPYTVRVFEEVAARVVGPAMEAPTQRYAALLERARLAFDVEAKPTVFVSSDDAWTNLTIRYLVPARERRRWSSALTLELAVEAAKPEHQGRIRTGYPRQIVELREP